MIIVGAVLLILYFVLPDFVPVPPGVETVLGLFGWILVIVGLILLLLGYFRGGPVIGTRRYWY